MTASKSRKAPERNSEPEITAQPRPIADEMVSRVGSEPGLSVDPDDLGSHFLSEATEQGNFESLSSGQAFELSVAGSPPTDAALVGPNFEPENSVWEQTVDLALQNAGQRPWDSALVSGVEEQSDGLDRITEVPTLESHIRELSLFDRESDEAGETIAPEETAEDGGRHARQTSHVPLGAQVEDSHAPEGSRKSETKSVGGPKLLGGTRSALKGVASKLRGVAKKLERSVPTAKRSR